METVIVALVVGAAGGLFGSIAGPYLSHSLDRGRRREIREEERRRALRQMLEGKIWEIQRLLAFTYAALRSLRLSLADALRRPRPVLRNLWMGEVRDAGAAVGERDANEATPRRNKEETRP